MRFNDKIRPTPNNINIASKRLTGLQYVQLKLYFEKIQPFQNEIIINISHSDNILKKSNSNEKRFPCSNCIR